MTNMKLGSISLFKKTTTTTTTYYYLVSRSKILLVEVFVLVYFLKHWNWMFMKRQLWYEVNVFCADIRTWTTPTPRHAGPTVSGPTPSSRPTYRHSLTVGWFMEWPRSKFLKHLMLKTKKSKISYSSFFYYFKTIFKLTYTE